MENAEPAGEARRVEEVDLTGAQRLARVDWGRTRDILLTVILGFLVIAALGFAAAHVSRIIIIVIASALVAYVASPLVARMEHVMPRWLGATLLYLGFLGVVVGAGAWIVHLLVPQLQELAKNLPADVAQLQAFATRWEDRLGYPGVISGEITKVKDGFAAGSSQSAASAGATAGAALGVAGKVTDALTNIVLVLVISFYFILGGNRFWAGTRALVPKKHGAKFAFVEMQLNRVVGGYIRGQLTLALIIGASVGIGMELLGVRYPMLLGVAGFFFELIPMIGPIMIGLLCLIVAAFQGFPLVLWVLIFYVLLQLVESNVLGPRISGHAVGLHPAASILALITGAELFGLWGAILAVPLTGLAFVIGAAIVKYMRGEPVEGLYEPRKRWMVPHRRMRTASLPPTA